MKITTPASVLQNKTLIRQFLLFAGVGIIGTTGHYIVLILLVQLANISPVYASTYGFIVGALINYYLNYHYTFKSTNNHAETLYKFMMVAGLGFILNGAIMFTGSEWMQFNYILVQLFATSIVLLSNFSLNKLWTFAHNDASPTLTDKENN